MTCPDGSGRLDPIPTSPWIRFWESGARSRAVRGPRVSPKVPGLSASLPARACRPRVPGLSASLPARACRPVLAGPRLPAQGARPVGPPAGRPVLAVPCLPAHACRPRVPGLSARLPAGPCPDPRPTPASPCPDPAASDAPRDSYGRSGCRPACGLARAEHGSSARCGPASSESARQVPMSALVVRACMFLPEAGRAASAPPRPVAQGPRVSPRVPEPPKVRGPSPKVPDPPKTVSPDWYASNPTSLRRIRPRRPGF